MNSMDVEPMSLATFEPNRAFAPYLNTPRSLEACRLHGVNPIELVEVPMSEFNKDFPNDPDAALRRFNRIDGARRRVLGEVVAEWKRLVSINWKPSFERPKTAKEAILEVSPEAHCTLLELQAQRFRKIETENWNAYQRLLRMEVKKADAEVKGKQILGKHEEIAASNDALRKNRMLMREALLKEARDRQRQKELDEAQRIKALQILDARYAQQKAEEEEQRRKDAKAANERREQDRVQREEYTRQMKDSILNNLEEKTNNKKRIVELRDKLISDRLEQNRQMKAKEMENKRLAIEMRVQRAKEEVEKKDEEERQATAKKLQEQDEYRRQLEEIKLAQKVQQLADTTGTDKLKSIQQNKENIVREKQEKTAKDLAYKEELARGELEKVKEAQERRRCIKSIKQESYEIAAARARKAQEYKMMKLTQALKEKEDRCNAIKKGFTVLNQMRNSMKDIMEKTTYELKTEMHNLRHNDEFRPDTVVDKALKVSDSVLFPRLEKTFGIVDPHANNNRQAFTQSNDMFGFDFDKKGKGGSETHAFSSATAADHQNGKNQLSKSMTELAIGNPNETSRSNFATLQIQSLTHDRLASALKESRERYAQADKEAEEKEKTKSPSRSGSHKSLSSTAGRKRSKHDKSILKLDPSDYPDEVDEAEDHHSRSSLSKARANSSPARQQTRAGSVGTPSPTHSKSSSVGGGALPPLTNDVVINEDGEISIKFNILSGHDDENSSHGGSVRLSKQNSIVLEPLESPEQRATTAGGSRKLKKIPSYLKAKPPIRTDVNEKAKFIATTPGKFRREFSLDHPLAAEGKGHYSVELKKGITPQGMDLPTKMDNDVANTLAVNNKIQKLTYTATNKVVDPEMQLEKIKKEQNEILKKCIADERAAEEHREAMGRTVTDPEERDKLDSIFAEERRRASDRIIAATKQHEMVVKQAVLAMMNLGVSVKSK